MSEPVPGPGTVYLYFSNGTVLQFDGCEAAVQTDEVILFTRGGQAYTFKKSALAGWSLPAPA
jgi:hypothetical protein